MQCASILRASRHVATDRYVSGIAHSIINFSVLAYNLIHRDSTKKKMKILNRRRGRTVYSSQIIESDCAQLYFNFVFVSGMLFSISQSKIKISLCYVCLVWQFIKCHVILTWIFYLNLLNRTKRFRWSERHQRRWKWSCCHCWWHVYYNFLKV